MRSLFIFRRDLRLDDNTALIEACEESDEVIACFILDPRQASPSDNPYFSANGYQFLVESLEDLEGQLKSRRGRLYLFEGKAEEVVDSLIEAERINAVYFNGDYTPFSHRRDLAIRSVCDRRGVRMVSRDDALLTAPGEIRTTSGSAYKVYSHFARNAKRNEPPRPRELSHAPFYAAPIPLALTGRSVSGSLQQRIRDLHVHGGRTRALEILDNIGSLDDYGESRDIPAAEGGTSSLSAYHKFGCVSIRETYWAVADVLGGQHGLIDELYWRDFFTLLAHAHPSVFGESFHSEYDSIRWRNDERMFELWKAGKTGFPIVDAGMRQLSATGWMHNRVRMIVASFLVKDLQIDWRWGERHFARLLVDYDPAVNNGNWQWAASTGADAQPYFRIFNPWNQGRRYDPGARYIKRWVPELADLDPKQIHKLDSNRPPDLDYPEPIVDHRVEAHRAQRLFEGARS